MTSIGSPVLDHTGAIVGALAVFAPTFRVPDNRVIDFAEMARDAADELSAAMGYSAPAATTAGSRGLARPSACARGLRQDPIPERRDDRVRELVLVDEQVIGTRARDTGRDRADQFVAAVIVGQQDLGHEGDAATLARGLDRHEEMPEGRIVDRLHRPAGPRWLASSPARRGGVTRRAAADRRAGRPARAPAGRLKQARRADGDQHVLEQLVGMDSSPVCGHADQ